MSRLVVLQSYRETDVPPWIEACLASVRGWADRCGHAYRFEGDALFDRLPVWYRAKAAGRPMVAADLARLLWAREVLEEADRVLWLDADVLLWGMLRLPPTDYAFGREVWVQRGPKAYRKVHNALAFFARGNPVLDFYIHACERLVERVEPPIPPQLVGPRLLGSLHNLLHFPLVDAVGSLSPLVLRDLLDGGGPALDCLLAASPALVGANLCAALAGTDYDGARLDDDDLLAAVEALRDQPSPWSSEPSRSSGPSRSPGPSRPGGWSGS